MQICSSPIVYPSCATASLCSCLSPPQGAEWYSITAKPTAISVVQVHGHALSSSILCFPWLSEALTEPGSRGFPLITDKEQTEISRTLKVLVAPLPKPNYPHPVSPTHGGKLLSVRNKMTGLSWISLFNSYHAFSGVFCIIALFLCLSVFVFVSTFSLNPLAVLLFEVYKDDIPLSLPLSLHICPPKHS